MISLLYLDNSATTPIHPQVKEAMIPFLLEEFGNPSSKYYALATSANDAIKSARHNVAKLINCRPDEIIFTSGSTESNNFVIKGITDQKKDKGNHIITTNVEHPSVLEVCKYLENIGFNLTILEANQDGVVTVEQFNNAITPQTIFASIQWGNNEIGSINPIANISTLCLENDIFLHSDATQVIGKLPIDLEELEGLSAISISAHKFFGPKGVGATFLRKDQYNIFPPITPLLHGGGQEEGLRSGTLAVHNIVGFGKASEIATQRLSKNIKKLHELELHLIDTLNSKFGSNIKYNHPPENKIPGIVNVQFIGINNEILVKKLAPAIALSTGSACSSSKPSHVLAAIGLSLNEIRQTIRISLSPYIEKEDLNIFNNL